MSENPMRVMVVGARGMLGTDLMRAFAADNPVGLDLPELDITNARQCRERVMDFRPEVIVHAAALTNVDYCESHEEEAMRINGEGTGNLASAARESGALLAYYSTDYVFDGAAGEGYREEDQTHPLSAYGRSKLRGEELLLSLCPGHLILRTSWLFGCDGKNFIRTIVTAARQGESLRVVNDQRGSPTFTQDLAAKTRSLLQAQCRGIYHVTNSGSCTWHELASRSIEWAGISGARIAPCRTKELPRPAPRPACSILLNARLLREGRSPLRSWQEAAQEYIGACLTDC